MLEPKFILKTSILERTFLGILSIVSIYFVLSSIEYLGLLPMILSISVLLTLTLVLIETDFTSNDYLEFKNESIFYTKNNITISGTITKSIVISPIGVAFYARNDKNEDNIFYKFIFRDMVSDEDWWRLCLISKYYKGV